MKHFILILLLPILVFPLLVCADAATEIEIHNPYARATPPGMTNSAIFLTLKNSGDSSYSITSASADVSEIVELHEHVKKEGMMQMRQIPEITVAAGGVTVLKPGGLHIMLIKLKQALTPGTEVSLMLKFSDNSTASIKAPVRKLQMMMKAKGKSSEDECSGD